MRYIFIHLVYFIVLLAFAFVSCQSPRKEIHEVDFTDNVIEQDGTSDKQTLSVAIATVISPRESFIYYQEMFESLSDHLGMPVEFKQRKTYEEVNELLARNLVDMAFICSGAYIQGVNHHELMFVPVVDGEPYYRGYVISNTNSNILRFEDFEGRSFAYSDPMCFTGSLYVDKRVEAMGSTVDNFFGEIVSSLSHDLSIQMVSRNVIDGASVNGLVFNYLEQHQPDYLTNIRIIEKSKPGGIPPVVNSLLMPRELRSEIQDFFLEMHQNRETREILDKLNVDQFIIAGDTLYDGLREIKEKIAR